MFVDTRSPFERHRDSQRCPTCGHRPQDEIDKIQRDQLGSGTIGTKTCPMCAGSGWRAAGYPAAPCDFCRGSGRVRMSE